MAAALGAAALRTRQRCLGHTMTYSRPRPFYTWIENLFNKVDTGRIRAVGPDRATAEYVFRMGGRLVVREVSSHGRVTFAWVNAESNLPKGEVQLAGVLLENTTVSDIGIRYFAEHLPWLRFLSLNGCQFVKDLGAEHISRLKLVALDVSGTGMTAAAVKSITQIHQLRTLAWLNLPQITDNASATDQLRQSLRECELVTDPAQRTAKFEPTALIRLCAEVETHHQS